MSLANLERKLNKKKNRIGLVGGRLKLRELSDAKEPMSACISPSDWHIEINVQKDYNPVRDENVETYVTKRNIANPLEKMCEDVLFHECGHWELPRGSGKGCPYDETQHDSILESISQVLKPKGKEGLTAYVANAFEDVLVNTNCRLHTDHSGQVLFWNEQGMTHGTFTKFYDAFVRLNLSLWADMDDYRLLRQWSTDDQDVKDAVKAIKNAWKLPRGRRNDIMRAKNELLYDKSNWSRLALQFAQEMEPLLDVPQPHQMFGAGAQAPGNPGSEQGSAFDKKLDSREGGEKAAHARYKARSGPATNRDSYEQLDALYRRLSRDIPVEVETFTQSYSFPLVAVGREQFDPELHDVLTRRVSVGLQNDGSVGLHVNKDWIHTSEVYKQNIRQFPKFRLALLDTSESMSWAPDNSRNVGSKAFVPWGDNSKYHYALLGYYGVEQFLQRQHIAPYVDSGAINFSAETQTASGSDSHRLLLTPQWGGTRLDTDVIRKSLNGTDAFLLSLSDGDVMNWDEIRDKYRGIMTKCAGAHIQIGEQNEFSSDLESWGVPVYYVKGGKDLAHLMVKVASDKYKSYGVKA